MTNNTSDIQKQISQFKPTKKATKSFVRLIAGFCMLGMSFIIYEGGDSSVREAGLLISPKSICESLHFARRLCPFGAIAWRLLSNLCR